MVGGLMVGEWVDGGWVVVAAEDHVPVISGWMRQGLSDGMTRGREQ